MNLYCINCKWFKDGAFSRVYISPQCNQRGQDSAAFMREFVCGLEGKLWESSDDATPERQSTTREPSTHP